MAEFSTLASVADPSQPQEMKVTLRSKSHANITFWLKVPFLFLHGAARLGVLVTGTWDPSIAPIQFCIYKVWEKIRNR
jgi:hypothetical protein